MTNPNQLPLYSAEIEGIEDGMVCLSLVEEPATESNFVLFSKENAVSNGLRVFDNISKPLFYFEPDDPFERRILTGVIMLADTPIYRNQGGREFYIQYSKETIEKMVMKLLQSNQHNIFDLNHDGERLKKGAVECLELYFVDRKKGIYPTFLGDNIPDGSLIGSYKVLDDEIWNQCKNGTFNGFSLEGFFTIEEREPNPTPKDELEELLGEIQNKLQRQLKRKQTTK